MASAISALTQRIADSMDLLNLPRVGAAFIGMWTLHFAADRVFRWVFGERVVGKLSRKDRLHMDEKCVDECVELAG